MQQIRIIEDNAAEPVGGGRITDGGDIAIPIKEMQSEQQKQMPIKIVEDHGQGFQSQEDTQEYREERRTKNRRPLKSRPESVQINRLNQLVNEKDNYIERLRSEAEYFRQQAMHKEQIATINHENALNIRKETAKTMMKEAMEAGDSEKVVEATEILSQAGTQLNELERAKQQYAYEPQYVAPEPQQQYYPQEEQYTEAEEDPYEEERREEINNTVNEFLIENPWCDPSNKKHYDLTKHKKYLYEGKRLAQKYIDNGQEDYLDSKEFLQEIAGKIPNRDVGNSGRTNTTQRSGSMVSPVNRGNGSYGGNNDELVMTRAEYDVFSRLPEVMRNKDMNHLATKYKEAKADLTRRGKIGRGLQMRPSSMGRF